MKKFLCFSLLLLLGLLNTQAARPVKVACVGNSITYGAGIANREANSYPAQLQYYLGTGYEVRNFGHSGATALRRGDLPYTQTEAYTASLAYQPDIVLIKLGTNDTKPQNWRYQAEFAADYQALIDTYRALPSHPRVILLTPVRCYLTEPQTINPDTIAERIRPTVEQLAYRNGLGIIHLSNLFGDTWDASLLPDRLHPSSNGAGMMARHIGEYLLRDTLPQPETFVPSNGTPFNFHGYRGYDFTLEGIACKVVTPTQEADGHPWVWRARFWGHEPQTDIALLEQGFHIVYCDVADLYGSDEALHRWDRFYRYLQRNGFHKQAVLEGMSRGGLILYNWAARHPERVACIYADAPVMDIKSWPLGQGTSHGSPQDAAQLLRAYGFRDTLQAAAWKRNPLDHATTLARARIPILHVVGDADKVVPVAENTAPFEAAMERLGAPITVIHKPGVGHHPHSLSHPEPIVRFILQATGRDSNPCIHAVPGNEYRSAAGWSEGSEWHSVAQDIEATLEGRKVKLLLLGNSITQGWGGNRQRVTYKPGKAAMDAALGEGCWESAGISGDRTQNLLWRIRHGRYNRCRPDYVAIAIGINNLIGGGDSPEACAEGIVSVTEEACREFPEAKILLLGLFPSGREPESTIRQSCDRIHALLAAHRFDERVTYIDPTAWFLSEDGTLRQALYSPDYIHLTPQGYQCIADHLARLIQ